MNRPTGRLAFALIAVAAWATVAPPSVTWAQDDANEIIRKSNLAYYYAADDGIADVKMSLTDRRGKERSRKFTMLRIDIEEGGDQKYYTYFREPSDVARLTFMVHKRADGNDLRWIYVPAVDLTRPVSADDKNSSFVGSDFTYEDVSGRHWTEDEHTLVRAEEVDGEAAWVIQSTPKDASYDGFARRLSYISQAHYLPLKRAYFDDKEKLVRRFTAAAIKEMNGIMTVTLRRMENLKKGSSTTVEFTDIRYDQGLGESLFTERYLKNPPRKYIR